MEFLKRKNNLLEGEVEQLKKSQQDSKERKAIENNDLILRKEIEQQHEILL